MPAGRELARDETMRLVKQVALVVVGSAACAALAEGIVLAEVRLNPWRVAALLESFALVLVGFTALSHPGFVRTLRHWAAHSALAAFAIPFLLLIPYFILALGTRTFSWLALAKLSAYIAVPTVLLLPDRLGGRESAGWRDFAAMASLAVPVAAGWLSGIWIWPQDLYVFRPLFCVSIGGYGFLVVRNLQGVGYRLWFRKADLVDAAANYVAFAIIAIPLGMALQFIHPHAQRVSPWTFCLTLLGTYLTVAVPEELLFRGVLQNFLTKTIHSTHVKRDALLVASVIFGLSHLHHAPVPNWRYGIMATVAGLFYGNTFNSRRRVSASALTHALVDTTWHFWF
jgi:membrane protease YdiL (CAAX protease family)